MIYEQPGRGGASVTKVTFLTTVPCCFGNEGPVRRPRSNRATGTRIVVLTQACDLALGQGNSSVGFRGSFGHVIWSTQGVVTEKTVRDQIRTHRVYGWYFLPEGPAMEESIVDLRNLHTIPGVMLEQLARWKTRLPDRDSLPRASGAVF